MITLDELFIGTAMLMIGLIVGARFGIYLCEREHKDKEHKDKEADI